MANIQEIVRDHRQHYLDRKLARSPLLHFSPGPHRIDVFELFRGVQTNLPTVGGGAYGVSEPKALIKNLLERRYEANIIGASYSVVKKLERMQKAASDNLHSTGQHTLFLGYPCIVLPVASGKSKLAPLTLFAINVVVSAQKITIKRVLDSNEQNSPVASDAILNRLVGSYIKREYGIDLNANEHRFDIVGAQIEEKIQHFVDPWPELKREFIYPETSQTISKEELKRLDPAIIDPYIADYAILGLAEFSGQALIDDLDKIEQEFEGGLECPPALSKLIKSAADHVDYDAPQPNVESGKWLVEKSDPSQESVVWSQKTNALVVLQGPPGTGKSQTIVNIVADALAQNKTVMVVCQKRAAIEVVHKRLSAVGLGDLAALVNDVDKDRLKIVRRIEGIDQEFPVGQLHSRERNTISSEIFSGEEKIDDIVESLNDKTDGFISGRMRFGDLKAQLLKLGFLYPATNWPMPLRQSVIQMMATGLTLEDLKRNILSFSKIDEESIRLRYGENYWSNVDADLESDQALLQEILSCAKIACDFGSELAQGKIPLQHDAQTSWIAEHPWLYQENTEFPIDGLLDSSGKRHDFGKFQHWLKTIRKIASVNSGVNDFEISASLRENRLDTEFLRILEEDSRELRSLLKLKNDIKINPVLNAADKCFSNDRGSWASNIHAMALHTWLLDLLARKQEGFKNSSKIVDLVGKLSTALIHKRALDATDILNSYQKRVISRNTLKNQNLLRLRAGQGRPKTSLRKLYSDGMPLLNQVLPLLLVSPETASSILPLRAGLFDVVIIDEASQMFVAEALPMLFRAKSAVIAGDRQQMPPADFFAYSDGEDDNDIEEDINDELDPLIAASGVYRLLDAADDALPVGSKSRLSLLVHYRSERKELIDFSNHAFYDGKLIIPAGNAELPAFMRTAIEFENVNGTFSRGVNEAECSRIVELLRNIWSTPISARPTIGVIVANARQRDRVLEVLQEQCDIDSKLQAVYTQEDSRESEGEDVSFFVRSVEHVQGDERDLIIFGLTYSGSSRSYGPLNTKNDGRKRLNVAITRAKRGMIVLTSLTVSHISNAAEKGSQERYYVWQYLNYAKAIASDDPEAINNILNQLNEYRDESITATASTESPFEDSVKEFIESLGFVVNCQVGESGFRIDLGVRTDKGSRNFLCGVECDGARYHSGWRARTNDVWRQEILESKGWRIFRIWSTDWFENAADAKNKLKDKLFAMRDLDQAKGSPSHHQFIRRATRVKGANTVKTPDISGGPRLNAKEAIDQQAKASNIEMTIDVGDTVDYQYIDSGIAAKALIVRGVGDPQAGTINFNTELAKALMDATIGEELSFISAAGERRILVVAIYRKGA
jgi:hypothetical protein